MREKGSGAPGRHAGVQIRHHSIHNTRSYRPTTVYYDDLIPRDDGFKHECFLGFIFLVRERRTVVGSAAECWETSTSVCHPSPAIASTLVVCYMNPGDLVMIGRLYTILTGEHGALSLAHSLQAANAAVGRNYKIASRLQAERF